MLLSLKPGFRCFWNFITARIRRMMGGYVFIRFCLLTRGNPIHPDRGYPHPSWRGGVPILTNGGTRPSQWWSPSFPMDGVPPSKTGWEYPHWDWMRVPPLAGLDGVPPWQDWMGHPPPPGNRWHLDRLCSRMRTFLLLLCYHWVLCVSFKVNFWWRDLRFKWITKSCLWIFQNLSIYSTLK